MKIRAPRGHEEVRVGTRADCGENPVLDPPAQGDRPTCASRQDDQRPRILERLAAALTETASGTTQTALGPPLAAARQELLRLARKWSGQYLPLPPAPAEDPNPRICLSGHQPTWFHPGIWFKSFLLDAAARHLAVHSVNLIIDHDLVKTTTLSVPAHGDGAARRCPILMDRGGVGIPYEERPLMNEQLARQLPVQVRRIAANWVPAHLLSDLWSDALHWGRELGRWGYGIAAARHRLEVAGGSQNLEIPFSWLCQSPSFHQFFVSVLERMEDLHFHYNRILMEFRQLHQITAPQRPLPDLQREGEWFELPFWLWSASSPRRQRMIARRQPGGWDLATDKTLQNDSELRRSLTTDQACQQLAEWSATGVRLRPRALMTTLYARGVLSQVFIHGLGGGWYDQITDRLAMAVWKVRLPDYLIGTATVYLNPPQPSLSRARGETLLGRLRDLRYNPDRIPSFAQQHPEWVAEKNALLAEIPSRGEKRDWHRAMQAWRERNERELAAEIQEAQAEWAAFRRDVSQQSLHSDRHWSLLLFARDLPQRLRMMAQRTLG